MKKISFIIITIILTLGLSFSLQSLLASWTAPTATPPLDNASEPLNRGGLGQDKIGGLILNSGNMTPIGLVVKNGDALVSNGKLSVSGDITGNNVYSADKIGIKDASSSEALSVGGTIEVLEGLASPTSRTGHGKIYSKLISYSSATDAQDKLMLHMDGVSATFIDSSQSTKTITANGGATQVSSQYKFGKSGYFNGSSYLTIPDSEDWNFGSGDFTIDAWVYLNAWGDGYQYINSQWQAGWTAIQFGFSNSGGLDFEANGCIFSQGDSSNWLGAWHHVAVVRNGSTFKMYKDGVSVASASCGGALPNVSSTLWIGSANGSGHNLNGYIDELRISKGVARWTTNFTPNTAAYGSSSSASALFYMDGAGHEYQLGVATTPSAPSGPITLIGGVHTSDDCSAAGGTAFNTGDGTYVCRIDSSVCPSGWTQVGNWTTTISRSCTGNWSCGCGSSCSTLAKGFSDSPPQGCGYSGGDGLCRTCSSYVCSPIVTQVGCR